MENDLIENFIIKQTNPIICSKVGCRRTIAYVDIYYGSCIIICKCGKKNFITGKYGLKFDIIKSE